MARNANQLPYFKLKQKPKEKILADFLLRKFRPKIKQKLPKHYLIQPIPRKTLEFIKEKSGKYPYFLRLDIRLYYPSINHQILLKKLPEIYGKLNSVSDSTASKVSRRFKKYLKNELPEFLAKSPYGEGLPIGSCLSYILAGIFLLDLDLEIKNPFVRQNDDYLIFCKNKKEPVKLLKNVILPKLQELNLELNEKKLKSGRFHQDKVNFIGFEFYAGYFGIKQEKIEEFKSKIIKLTYLTKKKPKEAIIKSLNNQILGFGHYYKLASCKKDFEDLDGFIRMRLRRYIVRNKDSKNREANIVLTNKALEEMGLKSLTKIKEKYAQKKRHIFPKLTKKVVKTGWKTKSANWTELEEIEFKYQQKLILKQLKELTGLVKKLERRMAKIDKKLVEPKTAKIKRKF